MYEPLKLKDFLPDAAPAKELSDDSIALLKAADLIRRNGLSKFALHKDGAMCLMGAINTALHGNPVWQLPWDGAMRLGGMVSANLGLGVNPDDYRFQAAVNWNNAPERTADEVIAALEAAAHA